MISTLLAMVATIGADTTIRAGQPLPSTPPISIGAVIAAPTRHATTPIVVEGVIVRSCTMKGCWMQLAAGPDSTGLRVDFDHKFFIPLKAAGMRARAVGVAFVKEHTKDSADHVASEGGLVTRKPDGSGTEIGFAATGVELRSR
jgi:hypothetical protein